MHMQTRCRKYMQRNTVEAHIFLALIKFPQDTNVFTQHILFTLPPNSKEIHFPSFHHNTYFKVPLEKRMFHPRSILVNSDSNNYLWIIRRRIRLKALRQFYLIECKCTCTATDHQNKNADFLCNLYQVSISMLVHSTGLTSALPKESLKARYIQI